MPGPSGTTTILCTRGRNRICRWCGRLSTKLCDYPVRVGDIGHTRTCDAPMCDSCATRIGENVDYCPNHAKQAALAKASSAGAA